MDNTGTVEWISCYLPGFDWNALRYTCPGNWEKLLGARHSLCVVLGLIPFLTNSIPK